MRNPPSKFEQINRSILRTCEITTLQSSYLVLHRCCHIVLTVNKNGLFVNTLLTSQSNLQVTHTTLSFPTLAQYSGKEESLMSDLVRRYGPEPEQDTSAAFDRI